MFFFVLSEKQTLDAMYEHISQLVKYLPIDISIMYLLYHLFIQNNIPKQKQEGIRLESQYNLIKFED